MEAQLITTALFIDPKGKVIASHTDYSQSTFSGFKLKRAQEIRCRDAMPKKILDAYCSNVISNNVEQYTAEKIMSDLRNKGFNLHYEVTELEYKK